jgi:hypothetical protein
MNKIARVGLRACLAIGLAAFSSPVKARQEIPEDQPTRVVFFDILDLPARIDEPRLRLSDKGFVLNCAVANRSGEELLGVRLILLVIDPAGKLRSRLAWTERADVALYSIKTFTFHPEVKSELRNTDQLFLGVEEVIGRETIWRAAGAEKALRAYSRGQPDVAPAVRTFANKYDPRARMRILRLTKRD